MLLGRTVGESVITLATAHVVQTDFHGLARGVRRTIRTPCKVSLLGRVILRRSYPANLGKRVSRHIANSRLDSKVRGSPRRHRRGR